LDVSCLQLDQFSFSFITLDSCIIKIFQGLSDDSFRLELGLLSELHLFFIILLLLLVHVCWVESISWRSWSDTESFKKIDSFIVDIQHVDNINGRIIIFNPLLTFIIFDAFKLIRIKVLSFSDAFLVLVSSELSEIDLVVFSSLVNELVEPLLLSLSLQDIRELVENLTFMFVSSFIVLLLGFSLVVERDFLDGILDDFFWISLIIFNVVDNPLCRCDFCHSVH